MPTMPTPLSEDARHAILKTLRRLDARAMKRGKRTTLTQAEKELDCDDGLKSLWLRRGLFDGWSGRPETTAGVSPNDSTGINDYHHGFDIGTQLGRAEHRCNTSGNSTKTH